MDLLKIKDLIINLTRISDDVEKMVLKKDNHSDGGIGCRVYIFFLCEDLKEEYELELRKRFHLKISSDYVFTQKERMLIYINMDDQTSDDIRKGRIKYDRHGSFVFSRKARNS